MQRNKDANQYTHAINHSHKRLLQGQCLLPTANANCGGSSTNENELHKYVALSTNENQLHEPITASATATNEEATYQGCTRYSTKHSRNVVPGLHMQRHHSIYHRLENALTGMYACTRSLCWEHQLSCRWEVVYTYKYPRYKRRRSNR